MFTIFSFVVAMLWSLRLAARSTRLSPRTAMQRHGDSMKLLFFWDPRAAVEAHAGTQTNVEVCTFVGSPRGTYAWNSAL